MGFKIILNSWSEAICNQQENSARESIEFRDPDLSVAEEKTMERQKKDDTNDSEREKRKCKWALNHA